MLEKLVERFRVRDVFIEQAGVRLDVDIFEQGADGRFDIAHEAKINGGAAADVFGILIDLDFLHLIAREEFGEGEVSTEHQQKVGVMNGAVGSAITEETRHADGVGIVMFEPLLAAEGIADGRL